MIWLIINGPKCAMWVMPCLQVLRVWHCSNVLFWCLQKCKNLPIWHTSARNHVFPWKSSTGALSRAWFAERVQTCRRGVSVFHIWLECERNHSWQPATGLQMSAAGHPLLAQTQEEVSNWLSLFWRISYQLVFSLLCVCHPALRWSILMLCN